MKKTINKTGHIVIILLVVSLVAVAISSAAVAWIIDDTYAGSRIQRGLKTFVAAETGIENAMLRLLRDPSYTGESLVVDDATVTISVTGGSNKTITSQASLENFSKKIEVQTEYTEGVLTIISWSEQP